MEAKPVSSETDVGIEATTGAETELKAESKKYPKRNLETLWPESCGNLIKDLNIASSQQDKALEAEIRLEVELEVEETEFDIEFDIISPKPLKFEQQNHLRKII